MMKELKSDEPYEVAAGCPTITFDLGDESLMLAYSSFASGNFKQGRIELSYQDWRIEIEGENLAEIWRLLQMQDVRSLMLSHEKTDGCKQVCEILKISAKKVVVE